MFQQQTELNLSQQHELFMPDWATPVTVIGAGSVGSHLCANLAKMGVPKITVFDADDVESHNVLMSRYRKYDVGRIKVEALKDIILDESGAEISIRPKMYEGEKLRDVVVACVDSMEARQLIWKEVRRNSLVTLFVDTRVVVSFMSVFAVFPDDPKDAAYYESFLGYSTKDAFLPRCGWHGLIHVTAAVAAVAQSNVVQFWKNGSKKLHHVMQWDELTQHV